MPVTIVIPDYTPYFLALLGLLVLWEVHEMQVRAGRIQANNFWDRTGIRMFVRMTPQDGRACPACMERCNTVLMAVASRKARATLHAGCTNPSGCRCLLIGLYGGWPEAHQLLERMKQQGGTVHLVAEDLLQLVSGPWERGVSASVDRVSIHLLEAMRSERNDPEGSVFRYRFVIDHAGADRDLPFVVPAYVRLAALFVETGQTSEALALVERFFQRYPDGNVVPHGPTDQQRKQMAAIKKRVLADASKTTSG